MVDEEFLIRLAAAVVLGTAVGLEREFRDKPAGLRTMILICAGACLFAVVSERIGGAGVDRTRIAAQIVTGVGFLGAGAILRDAKGVYGLTTAASIWMTAALGMACGFGKLALAFWGGVASLLVLVGFQLLLGRTDRARDIVKYRLATADSGLGFAQLDELFASAELRILTRNCYQEGDSFVFTLRAIGPRERHLRLREKLLHTDRFRLLRS